MQKDRAPGHGRVSPDGRPANPTQDSGPRNRACLGVGLDPPQKKGMQTRAQGMAL